MINNFFKKNNIKKSAEDFAKKSWSQCGEDLIIHHILHELKIEKPSWIDIGAHHPYYLNNTFLFYGKGGRGINIEPDPELFQKFMVERPQDKNLNLAIGEHEGELDFYVFNEPTLNTLVKEEAERINKEHPGYFVKEIKKVKTQSLNGVIEKYAKGIFPDLLSLDVEGLDEQILKAINYKNHSPKVICVETISFSTKGRGVKNNAMIEFLKENGYMVYADTNINTLFVLENLWQKRV